MVKTFKSWGPSFKVEFDIKVTKLPRSEYTNVFHFLIGKYKSGDRYGDRIPALWIRRTTCSFHIVSAVNGNRNYWKDFRFEFGKQYHITIQQLKVSGNYYYEIIIDGASKFKILNTMAKKYYNVKMYASDPWHQAFTSHFGWISAIKTQQSKKTKGT